MSSYALTDAHRLRMDLLDLSTRLAVGVMDGVSKGSKVDPFKGAEEAGDLAFGHSLVAVVWMDNIRDMAMTCRPRPVSCLLVVSRSGSVRETRHGPHSFPHRPICSVRPPTAHVRPAQLVVQARMGPYSSGLAT